MPGGLEVTVPAPAPSFVRARLNIVRKVAVTCRVPSILTAHDPRPAQPAPFHPVKIELDPGVAVRTTSVPMAYGSLQSAPQSMPPGTEVTVPAPSPSRITVRRG